MFKIEWVNHASYIFDDGEIRLITDPWLEGSVFNESWSLLSKTKFQYEDFKSITHIWFSHEHPDHFFPPNLKKIPKEYREKITILFQETTDHKVANFCRMLGFKDVIEKSNSDIQLSSKTSIYIKTFSNYDSDSWNLIKSGGLKFLNVNDCVLNSRKVIEEIYDITGSVDYLLTQFSYANWVGNPEDESGRKNQATEKLKRIKNQVEILKPKFVIPFASYVYFSKKDNFFMNSTVNKIGDVTLFLKELSVEPLVFYPGDTYSGEQWNLNDKNIEQYNLDFEKALNCTDNMESESFTIDQIKKSFQKGPFFNFNLKSFFAKLFTRLQGTPSVLIYLNDLNKIISFNIENKRIKEVTEKDYDLNLNSQNLNYLLSHEWGPGTILIAGTFSTKNPRGIKFINYMSEISHCVGQNQTFSTKYVCKRIINLALRKLERIKDKIFS